MTTAVFFRRALSKMGNFMGIIVWCIVMEGRSCSKVGCWKALRTELVKNLMIGAD
jgi:hypothetical protein